MKKHKSGIVFLVMFTACCLFAQGIWNMHDAEINGTFTFNQPQVFNKATTFRGAMAISAAQTLTSMVGIYDADGASELWLKGYEANDAAIYLYADEGDDAADKWSIKSAASGNALTLENNGTARFTLSSAGALSSVGTVGCGAITSTGAIQGTALTVTGGTVTGSSGTVTLKRADSGTLTLTSADDDANAALTVSAGGTGALTLGDTGSTTAISSSDWTIDATGAILGCTLTRAQLVQEDLAAYPVPVYGLRAADGDVLGIADTEDSGDHYLTYSAGVWALLGNSPNSDTQTDVSEFLFPVPAEYVAGQTITVRINALYTADGDTKTVDLNCYEITKLTGAKGSDICATAAITLSGTAAACDFTITPTDVAPGDLLSLVVTTVFQDSDGAVGEAKINSIDVLLDIKG